MSVPATRHKTASRIGAALALALFLAIGLRPAVYFGGYAGTLLANGILGEGSGGLLRALFYGFGAFLGLSAVGSLFAVTGGALGAAAGALGAFVASRRRSAPER
jgi:hypothetical protein